MVLFCKFYSLIFYGVGFVSLLVSFGYANRIPSELLLRYSFSDLLANPCSISLPMSSAAPGRHRTLAAIHRAPLRTVEPLSAVNALEPLQEMLRRARSHVSSTDQRALLIRELGLDIQQANQMARLIYPPSVIIAALNMNLIFASNIK